MLDGFMLALCQAISSLKGLSTWPECFLSSLPGWVGRGRLERRDGIGIWPEVLEDPHLPLIGRFIQITLISFLHLA